MKRLSMRPQLGRTSSCATCVPKFPRFRSGQQPKLREIFCLFGVWVSEGSMTYG
jgi:hypothetical protein